MKERRIRLSADHPSGVSVRLVDTSSSIEPVYTDGYVDTEHGRHSGCADEIQLTV
jgi:hypothetical protein